MMRALTGFVKKKSEITEVTNQEEILLTIKALVKEEIPDAKVIYLEAG